MRYIGVLSALSLLLAVTGTAQAISVIGEPQDADSWSQAFQQTRAEIGNKAFDLIQIRMNDVPLDAWSPDTIEKVTGFSLTGWNYALYGGGQYLVMSGPDVTPAQAKVTMNIFFTGPKSDPLSISVQVYNDGVRLQNQEGSWSGSAWSFSDNGSWNAQTAVPEPVTMAGVFLGIGCLGGYMRKRRAA